MGNSLALDRFIISSISRFSKSFSWKNPAWEALTILTNLERHISCAIHSSTEGAFIQNRDQVYIGKNTKIEPTAMIIGPCWIGNDCEIRHGAYIRPGTVLLDGCLVGHATEVARSFIFEKAKLAHFNYVGDSIVGQNVNLGAGVRLANYRLDGNPIKVSLQEKLFHTGLVKLGSILGDNVSIGCNSVLNPGTLVFPKKEILPGKVIQGVVY